VDGTHENTVLLHEDVDDELAYPPSPWSLVALPDNELALAGFLPQKVITLFNFNDGVILRNIKPIVLPHSMMLLPDGRRFVCAGGGEVAKISILEHGLALNL